MSSDGGGTLVSVFTAAHHSGEAIEPAYRSLLRQTHAEWEWVVADDSSDGPTTARLSAVARSEEAAGRVHVVPGPRTRSIGAAKATAAMACGGDVLVELDHDDELLPDALGLVAATFAAHPELDFAYSDWIDWVDGAGGGAAALYGPTWGYGYGSYASEIVGGRRVPVALAPPVTWETCRHLVGMPNHLRAWRTEFYRRIGGHDPAFEIADDYELLVRTLLLGAIARIPRPLYVQHHDSDGGSASRRFNQLIQRRVAAVAARWEGSLDRRLLALGAAPSTAAPLTDWVAVRAASPTIDVLAEEAEAGGTPLVSVVVPSYRRSELLRRALASILDQTYTNVEVLVVGDACPDVDAVIESVADQRVRHANLVRHHGDGGAAPRNHALKTMARGTLVAYLDDDNRWRPRHLSSLVDLLLADPAASYAFSSFVIDGRTIVCRRPRRFRIDTSALLHYRALLERFGYWKPVAETDWAHDWELVSRWDGEGWVASLEPTLVYSVETSTQGRRGLEAIVAADAGL